MNLSEQQRAEIAALEAMSDEDIDSRKYRKSGTCPESSTAPSTSSEPAPGRPGTDVTEKGLEALIEAALIDRYWLPGSPEDYLRSECVDLSHLRAFLEATQPDTAAELSLESDSPTRRRFLDRLKREITSRGIIDLLRIGIRHGQHNITLFYGTPSPDNTLAQERYLQNRFSVTRQPATATTSASAPWTLPCS